ALPPTKRRHRGADELHCVIYGQTGGYDATGRIDIERNFLLGIIGLEKQELGHDERGRVVVDRAGQKDDSLPEQAGINVEGAFTAVRLLDHHRHERVVIDFEWISHLNPLAPSTPAKAKLDAKLSPDRQADRQARRSATRHGGVLRPLLDIGE